MLKGHTTATTAERNRTIQVNVLGRNGARENNTRSMENSIAEAAVSNLIFCFM
jgi:hypothetical protein